MSTEPAHKCPDCGSEFSEAMEFCPVWGYSNKGTQNATESSPLTQSRSHEKREALDP
jgi:hypothetical protein